MVGRATSDLITAGVAAGVIVRVAKGLTAAGIMVGRATSDPGVAARVIAGVVAGVVAGVAAEVVVV